MGSLNITAGSDRSSTHELSDDSFATGVISQFHAEVYVKDSPEFIRKIINKESPDLREILGLPGADGPIARTKLADASPAVISEASKKLDNEISPMTPKDIQEDFRTIHHAVLSGNAAKLAESIKDIQAKHPELMGEMISELNKEFDNTHAGVNFSLTAEGKVIVYKSDPLDMNGEKVGLQINPVDGSISARPLKVTEDGFAVLEPGEILNADIDKIAKRIGNTASFSITADKTESFLTDSPKSAPKFEFPPILLRPEHLKRLPSLHQEPWAPEELEKKYLKMD